MLVAFFTRLKTEIKALIFGINIKKSQKWNFSKVNFIIESTICRQNTSNLFFISNTLF